MSRLVLINKNLTKIQTNDKFKKRIKKLKNIKQFCINTIKENKDLDKYKKMLDSTVKQCKNLTEKQKKALIDCESLEYIPSTIMQLFQDFPRNAFANRIRNRCIITGRPRGVHQNISRGFIRRDAKDLLLHGYKKI